MKYLNLRIRGDHTELNLTKTLEKFNPLVLSAETVITFNSLCSDFNPSYAEVGKLYIVNLSYLQKLENSSAAAGYICINDTNENDILIDLNIPVVILDDKATFNEVFNIIIDAVFSQQRYNDGKNKIIDAFTSNKGINTILNNASETINNPFYFFDKSNRLISNSTNLKIADSTWTEIISKRFIDNLMITNMNITETITGKNGYNATLLKIPDIKRHAINASVYVEGKQIGFVGSCDFIHPFDDKDIEIVGFVGKIISAQMSKSDFYRFCSGSDYEFFFLDLLKSPPPPDILELTMKTFKIKLRPNLVVFAINSSTENFDKNAKTVSIQNYLTNIIKNCHSIIYKGSIVFIIELVDTFISDNILNKMSEYLQENNLNGSFSNPFTNISKLKTYYDQACLTNNYAKIRENYKTINFFKDYIIDYMLHICTENTDFVNLRHPAIDLLMKYDENSNTQYLHTLKMYMKCFGNMSEAAQLLNIHYNTMKHRIQTIESLASISLKDPVTFLNLFISFRINEGLKENFFKYD